MSDQLRDEMRGMGIEVIDRENKWRVMRGGGLARELPRRARMAQGARARPTRTGAQLALARGAHTPVRGLRARGALYRGARGGSRPLQLETALKQ